MYETRRDFLTQLSATAAGLVLVPLPAHQTRLTADQLLERTARRYEEAEVRALALRALDAAKRAGAKYADVRFSQRESFGLVLDAGTLRVDDSPYGQLRPGTSTAAGFGVRAVVGDTWGFAGGSVFTAEAVERVARTAVELARDSHRRAP